MVEGADRNAELIFGQLRSLATAITGHAIDHNQTWPYVTVSHFDIRAQEAGAVAGSELILFAPIIDGPDAEKWAEYAVEKQDWIYEDLVRSSSMHLLLSSFAR